LNVASVLPAFPPIRPMCFVRLELRAFHEFVQGGCFLNILSVVVSALVSPLHRGCSARRAFLQSVFEMASLFNCRITSSLKGLFLYWGSPELSQCAVSVAFRPPGS